MSKAVGVDVGTMFFQAAEATPTGETAYKTIRNAFIELAKTEDINQMLQTKDGSKFQYVEDDKHVYVIGEDAIRFARVLPGKVELRRPLKDGVLNAGEDQKILVLNELIRSSIGKAPDKKSVVCWCVSSPAVDGSANNTFHQRRVSGMFENQGWNVVTIEEGLAVILAENPSSVDKEGVRLPFTGIGMSFGAGRVNAVLAYKGVTAIGMSTSRSGDYCDREVSAQLNIPIAQATAHKENNLDFDNIDEENDLDFGYDAYTDEMIKFNVGKFCEKWNSKEDKSDFDFPLDIVIAGGTSKPKGFIGKVERAIGKMDVPFKIREIRAAKDPRNTVVTGLLARATIAMKELAKKDSMDEILKS